jgi:hypothetical protein
VDPFEAAVAWDWVLLRYSGVSEMLRMKRKKKCKV